MVETKDAVGKTCVCSLKLMVQVNLSKGRSARRAATIACTHTSDACPTLSTRRYMPSRAAAAAAEGLRLTWGSVDERHVSGSQRERHGFALRVV